MTLDKFVESYSGKKIDVDGMYGNQCKDLFSLYNTEVVGNPEYVWGNAKDLFAAAPDKYYEKIKNTPAGVPRKGDVIIWNIKPYGHVGIYVSGNANDFVSFDQNYAGHLEPSQLVKHDYKNVIGWLRPKTIKEDDMSDDMLKKVIWNVVDRWYLDYLNRKGLDVEINKHTDILFKKIKNDAHPEWVISEWIRAQKAEREFKNIWNKGVDCTAQVSKAVQDNDAKWSPKMAKLQTELNDCRYQKSSDAVGNKVRELFAELKKENS
jgi:hypothetical protein